MGGYGSGRYGGRVTAEACGSFRLHVGMLRTLIRAPSTVNVRGVVIYDREGDEELTVEIARDRSIPDLPEIILRHERRTDGAEREAYTIGLQRVRQPFGGVRWYFTCPRLNERVAVLWLPRGGHRFMSRAAYRLGFASQRLSALDRAHKQGHKLYRRLGGQGEWTNGVPPKPKWMRWKTYDRAVARIDRFAVALDGMWYRRAERLVARCSGR